MSDIEQRLSRLESLIKGMIVFIAIVLLAFNSGFRATKPAKRHLPALARAPVASLFP